MPDQLIKGNYVAIPEKTLKSKEWRNLQASTRCVYQIMFLRYRRIGEDANGRVTWLHAELVKQAGFSLRTIRTCLAELRDGGWIEIVCHGTSGTTYNMNSLYANG